MLMYTQAQARKKRMSGCCILEIQQSNWQFWLELHDGKQSGHAASNRMDGWMDPKRQNKDSHLHQFLLE